MYNLSVFLNNSKIREGDSFLFFKGNFTRVSKKEDKGKEKKKKKREIDGNAKLFSKLWKNYSVYMVEYIFRE